MHITNLISQYFGKFANYEFPTFFQTLINNFYVRLMKLDMSEFRHAKHYKSLNDLFTRELAIKREVDLSDDTIISPCDSFISASGKLEDETLLQIKGMEYNLEELLTYHVSDNLNRVKNGDFMNFYLSPKDYHRYHAPSSFKISKLIHVPGKLYPVNIAYLNKEIDLFCQNERVILECTDKANRLFYMVFVGALNVGQMVFDFEPKVETNINAREVKVYTYDNLEISKADCLGYFKMGSTIVMIWEKDLFNIKALTNQKVSFGTIIGRNN